MSYIRFRKSIFNFLEQLPSLPQLAKKGNPAEILLLLLFR